MEDVYKIRRYEELKRMDDVHQDGDGDLYISTLSNIVFFTDEMSHLSGEYVDFKGKESVDLREWTIEKWMCEKVNQYKGGDILVGTDEDGTWLWVNALSAPSKLYCSNIINLTDGTFYTNMEGLNVDKYIKNIKRASQFDLDKLKSIGYKTTDTRLKKRARVVADNGCEGEFLEEWTSYDKGSVVWSYAYKEHELLKYKMDSWMIGYMNSTKTGKETSPCFKTKKKLFQYLASIAND